MAACNLFKKIKTKLHVEWFNNSQCLFPGFFDVKPIRNEGEVKPRFQFMLKLSSKHDKDLNFDLDK